MTKQHRKDFTRHHDAVPVQPGRSGRARRFRLRAGGLLLTLAGALSAAGCTNQQVYESTEAWRISQCDRYAPRDRDECLATAKMPYSEYKANRREPVPRPTPTPAP